MMNITLDFFQYIDSVTMSVYLFVEKCWMHYYNVINKQLSLIHISPQVLTTKQSVVTFRCKLILYELTLA